MANSPIAPDLAAKLLTEFLEFYAKPSFSSPPKRDIDAFVYRILRDVNWVAADASLFEISNELRVTRSKAKALVFDYEIRKASAAAADQNALIKSTLVNASPAKDGDYFVFDVENPYVQAIFRERVRKLGHVTDATFNPSLIRMSTNALASLVETLLTETERKNLRAGLIQAGAKPEGFHEVVSSALKALPGKAAGGAATAAGGAAAKSAGTYLASLFGGMSISDLSVLWSFLG